MNRFIVLTAAAAVAALSAVAMRAQSPVQGVFFHEGWESGSLTGSFNSQNYGRLSSSSQFRLDSLLKATGNWALEDRLPAGLSPDDIAGAVQHFGDAPSGPVLDAGRGHHFYDLYLQYKVRYSPGFDFGPGHFKQFFMGTQDDRRHDEACCVPFTAHYFVILVDREGALNVEGNVKQANSYSAWNNLDPNVNGYSQSNRLYVETGRWYTIEVRRLLNDAGVDNGIFQMWVDGQLVADYRNVRHRIPPDGAFGSNFLHGSNFILLTDYTTYPVPQNQSVHYDDVMLSTSHIGVGGGGAPTAPANLRIIP